MIRLYADTVIRKTKRFLHITISPYYHITAGILLLTTCYFLLTVFMGCGGGGKGIVRKGDYWGNQAALAQFQRAEKYFNDSKFNEAITEYRYYLDQFGDMYNRDEAQKRIAEAFVQLNQWNEAIVAYKVLYKKFPKSQYVPEAILEIGKLYEQIFYYKEAVLNYRILIDKYYKSPQTPIAIERINSVLSTKLLESKWAKMKQKEIDKLIDLRTKE